MLNRKYKLSVIIAGAGNSQRLGSQELKSKQFLLIEGKPLLYYSIEKFLQLKNLFEIVVVTNDIDSTNELLSENKNLKEVKDVKIKTVLGGKLRQDSVYNGFNALDNLTDLVLIHDVGRPLFKLSDVEKCIEKAIETKAAILAVPVVDTIKKAISDKDELLVEKTIDREELYLIQTPQVFSRELLADIYNKIYKNNSSNGQFVVTDEASMIELLGKPVNLVIGDKKNIKVTYPEDLEIAIAILKEEKKLKSEKVSV